MHLLSELQAANVAGGVPILVTDEWRHSMYNNCVAFNTVLGGISIGMFAPCVVGLSVGSVVIGTLIGTVWGGLYGMHRASVINDQLIDGKLYEHHFLLYI